MVAGAVRDRPPVFVGGREAWVLGELWGSWAAWEEEGGRVPGKTVF